MVTGAFHVVMAKALPLTIAKEILRKRIGFGADRVLNFYLVLFRLAAGSLRRGFHELQVKYILENIKFHIVSSFHCKMDLQVKCPYMLVL